MFFFFQAEDGIRDFCLSRGLGDVYKRQVRDPAVHEEVLQNFISLAKSLDFTIRNLTFSPVKGPEGNIEFLAHLSMQPGEDSYLAPGYLVAQAHAALKG